MIYETYTNAERIIAKIDNDFNLDNSDWISRTPAWIYDALSQLDILSKKVIRSEIEVKNGVVYKKNCFGDTFKIFDVCNNEIKEYKGTNECCDSSTGSVQKTFIGSSVVATNYEEIEQEGHNHLLPKHTVVDLTTGHTNITYTKIDDDKIYLSSDSIKKIILEYKGIETYYSKVFKVELPRIPNNGTLIEAITYYCMYKMLCRGNKHPVFNLAASQYGTNPYYMWIKLKDEAKRSVINDIVDEKLDTDAWKRFFYNATFYNE